MYMNYKADNLTVKSMENIVKRKNILYYVSIGGKTCH